MARTVRDARLETRNARLKLPTRHDPYWKAIDGGMHIGYRKGRRRASWIGRYRNGNGKYTKAVLSGVPDDNQDSDGVAVLSFSQAQEQCREWFSEQARSESGLGPRGPHTVKMAMKDYLDWYAAYNKPSGLAFAKYTVDAHIIPELGDIELRNLKAATIRRWHQDLAKRPPRVRTRKGEDQKHRPAPKSQRPRKATANRILTVLRAALSHAWHDDKVASDEAWRRVKPFSDVDAPRVRYLTPDECSRLVNACEPDFRHLVQAALLTGCRYGEIIAMLARDFSRESGAIHIQDSKSGKPRNVPLNDEGVAFFDRATAGKAEGDLIFVREDGDTWGPGHQRRRVAAAAKAAKVKDVSFHILRHSYGSALAMQGVPMGVIAAAMGHADTRMTERHYAALAPSYVADTIRANLPNLGIAGPDNVSDVRKRR